MNFSHISDYGKPNANNILIEGENLIVLNQLLEEYEKNIDVIIIDPPYNTDIHYIGYKDTAFIGGWGKFMKNRLSIAKEFLSETGVMFINIDENELVTLLNICYGLFGLNNVNLLVWPKVDVRFDKNRIEKSIKNIRSAHEYIILCYNNKEKTHFKNTSEDKPLESVIFGLGTTSSAKDEIAELLGDRTKFSTPKPVALIKELIHVSSNKSSIILDFFAGSGTTGHAVMDLNNEDGGFRKFILITNNESNICKSVTCPRLKNCIKINKYSDGFSFFKAEY
ncbi:DNA methyltransferase [Methanoplanus endosymbiosus]|uniref:Site-specific DNA-methyltransferase n=1 Tax=Methanoplanus endosymbiosus TaxID=33865 RepID=A0A9E7PQ81_9EURY|nr:site-specific DNA-methyltransferase [Methanoplanus endosymbiosus]UUX93009.1 site-specific DNA-methyltransferase [Methanoplanus endosymbiosus]